MDAIDRGGDLYLEDAPQEVINFLANFPPDNQGDGRFARQIGNGAFAVDRATWREAQQLVGVQTHEAGDPAGHRTARQRAGMDHDAREQKA
jgi:hypothetical protein